MTKDFTEKKSDKECTLIVASDKKMNKDRQTFFGEYIIREE